MTDDRHEPRPQDAPQAGPGALKQQEKERLEREISGALENLRGSLSREQVAALMEKLASARTRQGLDALRADLDGEKTLAGEGMSDEARAAVLRLINDVQRATQMDISELRLEVRRVHPSPHWEPLPEIYPTNKVALVRKLGESPLGKNLIFDVAGAVAGTLDSAAAVIKLLLAMIQDVFLLPRDVARAWKNRKRKREDS